jgi:hypothetical protein
MDMLGYIVGLARGDETLFMSPAIVLLDKAEAQRLADSMEGAHSHGVIITVSLPASLVDTKC